MIRMKNEEIKGAVKIDIKKNRNEYTGYRFDIVKNDMMYDVLGVIVYRVVDDTGEILTIMNSKDFDKIMNNGKYRIINKIVDWEKAIGEIIVEVNDIYESIRGESIEEVIKKVEEEQLRQFADMFLFLKIELGI